MSNMIAAIINSVVKYEITCLEAENQLRELFKQQVELWRDEEYIPIDEFLAQIEKL